MSRWSRISAALITALVLIIIVGAVALEDRYVRLAGDYEQLSQEYERVTTFQAKSGHFAPVKGWVRKPHVLAVKEKGATPCFDCHQETDCSICHVKEASEIMERPE